jgi:hypothetical protein
VPRGEDHRDREQEAERGRGLDERRVQPAPARRRVLGHVGGGAAVLAAEREPLQQPQRDERHRGDDPHLVVRGEQPTSAVAAPMIAVVSTKVRLRPSVSPERPNSSAPNGRTANPAPNVASEASSAAVSFPGGKNSPPKNTASDPYR